MHSGPNISYAYLWGSTFTKRSSGCVLMSAMMEEGSKKGAARVWRHHLHDVLDLRAGDTRAPGFWGMGDACVTVFLPICQLSGTCSDNPSDRPSDKFARPLILVNLSPRCLPKTAKLLLLTLYGVLTPTVVKKRERQRAWVDNQPSHSENEKIGADWTAAATDSTSRRRFRQPL